VALIERLNEEREGGERKTMGVKILRGRKFMAIGVVSCLKSNILQNVLLFAVINIYIYLCMFI
jgi:hypothetical protein